MLSGEPYKSKRRVALLAEGVGRNSICRCWTPAAARVALLAEGVGRNLLCGLGAIWMMVALLAEGVGRNAKQRCTAATARVVALLAEGVGRNPVLTASIIERGAGRPPRGGRG